MPLKIQLSPRGHPSAWVAGGYAINGSHLQGKIGDELKDTASWGEFRLPELPFCSLDALLSFVRLAV